MSDFQLKIEDVDHLINQDRIDMLANSMLAYQWARQPFPRGASIVTSMAHSNGKNFDYLLRETKEQRLERLREQYKDLPMYRSVGTTTGKTTRTTGDSNVSTTERTTIAENIMVNGQQVKGSITESDEPITRRSQFGGYFIQLPYFHDGWPFSKQPKRVTVSFETTSDMVELTKDGELAGITIGAKPQTLDQHVDAVREATNAMAEFVRKQDADHARQIELKDQSIKNRDDQLESRPGYVGDLQDAAKVALELLEKHETWHGTELEGELRRKAVKKLTQLNDYTGTSRYYNED